MGLDSGVIYPAYLNISKREFEIRIKKAYSMLNPCHLCPRGCSVNRIEDRKGFCRSGVDPIVSSFNKHFGEEPPISGRRGSGTIFFTNCNMGCVFCQNYPISQIGNGREIGVEGLAMMMLSLQKRGCHNINLVTPTHFIPQIIEGLSIAVEKGLHIPIVYNSGGYDSVKALELLYGIIDVYMPDMKYGDPFSARRYSNAEDYPEVNRRAIREMHRQVGDLQIDNDGIAIRGLLIRHLVLPEDRAGTKDIMRFISRELSRDTYISLMDQYFPANKAIDLPELSRRIRQEEYNEAFRIMTEEGLENGWIQRDIIGDEEGEVINTPHGLI